MGGWMGELAVTMITAARAGRCLGVVVEELRARIGCLQWKKLMYKLILES